MTKPTAALLIPILLLGLVACSRGGDDERTWAEGAANPEDRPEEAVPVEVVALGDVTGIDAAEGETVEIFGKTQPVSELASLAGTIPYEMLTSVPERVKRVYLQE